MATETKIFDFHFHLLFKAFIKHFENVYPSQRKPEDLKDVFDIDHFLWDKVDEWFLHFLDSQSSFKQISDGKVVDGFIAIAPIEQMFASKEGLGGMLLNDQVVTNPMDPDLLDAVREGTISYYQLFMRELNLYRILSEAGHISFYSRSPKATKNNSGRKFSMGMEGGHSLIRSRIGRPGQEDDLPPLKEKKSEDNEPKEIYPLYEDFRQHKLIHMDESLEHLQTAMWEIGMDLRYLILTHLSNIPGQQLANHAYGAKFLKSELKFPVGMGITNEGKRVIDKAHTLKVNGKAANILIDIKHMSLRSRKEFYDYRRAKGYTQPIVASHMGVTGYSIAEWQNALDIAEKGKASIPVVKLKTHACEAGQWGKIKRTFHFNPWTINLMDDDIVEVVESGGLIGVSLDVRILGFVSRFQDLTRDGVYEYMSPEEFRHFFPYYHIKGLPLESYESGLESELFPNKQESHMLVFCFNILHIVSVIKTRCDEQDVGDAWQYVSIGSDFDGLIDPLKSVRDAGKLPNLRGELKKWLPVAEKSYFESNGGDQDLIGKNINKRVEQFLYLNGKNFQEKIMK